MHDVVPDCAPSRPRARTIVIVESADRCDGAEVGARAMSIADHSTIGASIKEPQR